MKQIIVLIIVVIFFTWLLLFMGYKIGYIKGQTSEINKCTHRIDSAADAMRVFYPRDTVYVEDIDIRGGSVKSEWVAADWDKSRHNVKQKVILLSDGTYNLSTWVWSDGEILDVLLVYEGGPFFYSGSNHWRVPKITEAVKKRQYERGKKILEDHLAKMKPYKPIK